MDKDGFLNEDE